MVAKRYPVGAGAWTPNIKKAGHLAAFGQGAS